MLREEIANGGRPEVSQGEFEAVQLRLARQMTQCKRERFKFLAKVKKNKQTEVSEAWRHRRTATVYRGAKSLASWRLGPKKRRWDTARTYRTAKWWLDEMGKEGTKGGMSAEEVDYEIEARKWDDDDTERGVYDMNVVQQAEDDWKDMCTLLNHAPKRCTCPPWAIQTSLLTMIMMPNRYVSQTGGILPGDKAGIGADVSMPEMNATKAILKVVLCLVHAT